MAGLSVPRGRLKSSPSCRDGGATGHVAATDGSFRYELDRSVSSLDLLSLDLTNETLLRDKLLKVIKFLTKKLDIEGCVLTANAAEYGGPIVC